MNKEDSYIVSGVVLTVLVSLFYFYLIGSANPDTNIDLLFVVLSFFAAISAYYAYARLKKQDDPFAKVFLWIAASFGLSAIAEVISAAYPIILGATIPMLSFADVFWLASVLPGSYALYLALVPTSFYKRAVGITIGSFLVITLLAFTLLDRSIIVPTSSSILNFVNILYILTDILIISLCIPNAIAYFSSAHNKPWLIIATALAVVSLADIVIYSSAHAYFILIDLLYYLWIGIGALAFVAALKSGKSKASPAKSRP